MSYNLTPITARVQKNSKGGVTEPYIKGIGVAKMKETSIAKLNPNITSRKRGGYNVSEKPYVKKSARNAHLRNANKLTAKVDKPIVEKVIDKVVKKPVVKKVVKKVVKAVSTNLTPKKVVTIKAKRPIAGKIEIKATIKPTKNVSKKVGKKLTKAAKAVDEGRDKKADRLYKRAARIENREIKKDDRKKARAAKKKAGQASKAINPNS
jgi:hypothetical protein|tara:strand:- start:2280 stop:2903 length:624 start_codon:yes stop_codon:yes gene_type:complete